MRLKFLSIFAASLLLAACGTTQEETAGGEQQAEQAPATITQAAPAQPAGPTPGSQEHLLINVGDRVFFDFDRSDLRPEARSTVEALKVWMDDFPATTLTIEGHCDERGTREYNLALGERRANAVRDYLVALGIDGGRLSTISYGKERPDVLGSTDEAWAKNRRGVFIVN